MKIGIFTFHRPINYGALLQTYAMTQIFGQYGEVKVIDYYPDHEKAVYSLLDFRFLQAGNTINERLELLVVTIKKLVLLPLRFRKQRKYRAFINEYLSLSPVYNGESQTIPIYDTYVYGSDQIWRCHKNSPQEGHGADLIYFGLNVPKGKAKIAYAASCGSLREGFFSQVQIKELLNDFTKIGARELYLTHELKQNLTTDVHDVLDPTMLVSREHWKHLAEQTSQAYKMPYLLIYNLAPSEVASAIAKKIANNLGLKIVSLNGYDSFSSAFLKKDSLNTAGPIEFLSLIKNASFVVSSSYHGVIFSILFGKQFYASGMFGRSDRVESLLKKLNLTYRHIEKESHINLNNPIDYQDLNVRLNILIDQSKKFVDMAMQ